MACFSSVTWSLLPFLLLVQASLLLHECKYNQAQYQSSQAGGIPSTKKKKKKTRPGSAPLNKNGSHASPIWGPVLELFTYIGCTAFVNPSPGFFFYYYYSVASFQWDSYLFSHQQKCYILIHSRYHSIKQLCSMRHRWCVSEVQWILQLICQVEHILIRRRKQW